MGKKKSSTPASKLDVDTCDISVNLFRALQVVTVYFEGEEGACAVVCRPPRRVLDRFHRSLQWVASGRSIICPVDLEFDLLE